MALALPAATMSILPRIYPLLTLCTLGCTLPPYSSDTTTTSDDDTTGTTSEAVENPTITESILTSTTEEPTSSTTGSDDTGDKAEAPPAAPTLSLGYSPIKHYDFSWDPVAGAEYYQLLERPYPSVPGWSQLGGDLLETSTSWSMPIHLRMEASYMLRACNASGCSESEPVPVKSAVDKAMGYFKASNAESEDYFGNGLAISADGTTMVVGAMYESGGAHGVDGPQHDNSSPKSGAAYVFVREGDSWKQQAYLKAFNADDDDQFGGKVAISANGDTIAIGAPYEDSAATGIGGAPIDNSAADSGAAYVFARKAGVWSQEAYIKASNTAPSASFGYALALSANGNTLAVGASEENNSATGVNGNPWQGLTEDSGAVYVYSRDSGEWTHRAYLKASNTGQGDSFGAAVALSADGTTLAVGAPYEGSKSPGIDGDQSDDSLMSGAAYVFVMKHEVWTQQAYIKASNPGLQDGFSYAIALSLDGNTLAIGAPFEFSVTPGVDDEQPNQWALNEGAVYVFSRLGQTWQQDAYIKAPNVDVVDFFGASLALSGDGGVLIAGAPGESGGDAGSFADLFDETKPDSGAAYVFTRVAGTWTHRNYLKAPNSGSGEWFGSEVALTADGGTVVIAAPNERSLSTGIGGNQYPKKGEDVGAVYMY
ncbi:FG-GAP repeat protein [Nannocystis radixulma]|uniref:Integrin n=1 Tax=Nannocystis radixulma TaxID=2995305 RepID=A0ABT5B566_9BACT|nr:FG-GAP repeat protein [Nannocystis radixulma]MDC0668618.1 integrin [Nannocystis radixulma]